MKMIDVLNMMAKGEIKEGAKLKTGYKIYDYIKDYTESENCSFVNQEDDRIELLEDNEFITTDFLNYDVELIRPNPKKYQLKLYEDDDLSYVTFSPYKNIFNYDVSDKNETCNYRTKFTQEQIDSDKFLKFIEQHGIKEEVE